jgi:predicted enzyme related to lactoylglutathione lyase
MTARLFRVILPVSDLETAAIFYAQVLGSPGERIAAGRHYFTCGETILACLDPVLEGDGVTPLPPNPEYLYFAVDDLEATRTAVEGAGGEMAEADIHGDPAGEIAVRPWRERSFYAVDPFGNKICFVDETTVFTGHRSP